jgi:hypothetical protein
MKFRSQICRVLVFGTLPALLLGSPAQSARQKPEWANSPLSVESQVQLDRAGKLMKSGKYDRAKPAILSALSSANDVPKCLAIAEFTETYAFPLMEVRRECCNKALSLCSSDEDYLLMALKARHYQFYEITRQSISKLTENAKTLPQLFSLARKAHEVSLNDVAHMALEKAASGIRTGEDWQNYAENCKALGMDDLLRKAIKRMIDEEDDSVTLCKIGERIQRYGMRDEIRYCLRKALDKVSSDLGTATSEMAEIAETARLLNEPDVKLRAEFFVKKGNYMLKQRGEQDAAERRSRAERERQSLDDARLKDGSARPGDPGANPGKPSTGY